MKLSECIGGPKALSVQNVVPSKLSNGVRMRNNQNRLRYHCNSCGRHFDDLSDSIFAGRHQPLRVWVGCLYLMGLNLSNQQIAQELDLNKDDVQHMTSELRQEVVDKKPQVKLSGEVEFDEVYVTAGHKGNPEAVKKKGIIAVRRRKLKGLSGAGGHT